MKIVYITTYDSKNLRNWSGLGYYIAKALKEQDIEIEYINSLTEYSSSILRIKDVFYRRILKKKHQIEREPLILKKYAEQILGKLSHINADIVFSPGTIPISYLDCPQPVVFWTDSNFAGMADFYPEFRNLSKSTIINGNKLEQAALERSQLAIYASDWAANIAVDKYNVERSKVKVVPFGANIESNFTIESIKPVINARPKTKCKLLFLGVDWYRKGGDIAFKVAEKLNSQKLQTELHIVGCNPDLKGSIPDYVYVHGFIDKSNPKGLEKIKTLLTESHFLILPSRAECFGVVFCEASSFGLPSIASKVGGIPTAIREGINGKTFSLNADIKQYCDYISNLMSDFGLYQELALSSFNEYTTRLNWTVAGKTVMDLLNAYCF